MHFLRDYSKYEPYQTVRAAFMEGDDLYPDAGFKRKNHIQLAVVDPYCINGDSGRPRTSARDRPVLSRRPAVATSRCT